MARFAIGMDVHKNTCSAHMVCADYGKDSEKIRKYIDGFNERFGYFPTRADEFVEFARVVKEDDCYVLIENSTKSHDVYWMLRNLDVDVTVAHSTDLYRITKSVTKNDANDARELAGYMRRKLNGEVEFAESFIPSPEWMRNRELCRFLANDKLDLQTVKKQIRAYLLLHGIRTRKEYSDITSVRAMKELREIGDPVLLLYVNKAEELKKRISFTEKTILSRFPGTGCFRSSIP